MAVTKSMTDWVQRVLDVDVRTHDSSANQSGSVRSIWTQAKDAIDTRLEVLGQTLRKYNDEQLNRIAEYGLFGLTEGGTTVGLISAMLEYDSATGARRETAAAVLRKAIQGYRGAMQGNRVMQLVDNNPFGVKVGLVATLDSALRQIEGAVR
jgi:hypothetical protein